MALEAFGKRPPEGGGSFTALAGDCGLDASDVGKAGRLEEGIAWVSDCSSAG